jgi:Spy/CpxP family protein refolding chaperone
MKKIIVLTLIIYGLNSFIVNANTHEQDSIENKAPIQLHKEQPKTSAAEMVLVAEANNYPSPQKALQYAQQLNLSSAQKTQINQILYEMNRKVKEMGNFILIQENKLHALFKEQKINDGSLIFYTNKIGALQGELRNAYLKAYIATKRVFTTAQLNKYKQLVVRN